MQIFATSRHFLHIVWPKKIFFKGLYDKSRSNKVGGSKNVFNKSSRKFLILMANFLCLEQKLINENFNGKKRFFRIE